MSSPTEGWFVFGMLGTVFGGIALYKYYTNHIEEFQLKCIVSNVDGQKYCVRDRKNTQQAVDLLAKVARNCNNLIIFLNERYPHDLRATRLKERFSKQRLMETLPTSEMTAYTLNKGEKVAMCLNRRGGHSYNNHKLIDINTLTFVALHELSHIATTKNGHLHVFWQNFKWILNNAVEIGIYDPVDYKKENVIYCGDSIDDNPFYDLK